MATNKGIHTNQIARPKAAWTYHSSVSPVDANDTVDRAYVESKSQLSHRTYNDLDPQTNGSNTSFTTSVNYTTGTLLVLDEGLKVDQSAITETGPNTFSLNYAPVQRLEVYFLPTGTISSGEPNTDRVFYVNVSRPLYIPEMDNCLVLVDTTSGNITLDLPSLAELTVDAIGLRIRFKNIGINDAIISPAPSCKVDGVAGDYTLASAEESGEFVFVPSLGDFVLISNLQEAIPSEAPNTIEADAYSFVDTSVGLASDAVGNIRDPIVSVAVEWSPFIMES